MFVSNDYTVTTRGSTKLPELEVKELGPDDIKISYRKRD